MYLKLTGHNLSKVFPRSKVIEEGGDESIEVNVGYSRTKDYTPLQFLGIIKTIEGAIKIRYKLGPDNYSYPIPAISDKSNTLPGLFPYYFHTLTDEDSTKLVISNAFGKYNHLESFGKFGKVATKLVISDELVVLTLRTSSSIKLQELGELIEAVLGKLKDFLSIGCNCIKLSERLRIPDFTRPLEIKERNGGEVKLKWTDSDIIITVEYV